jgi:hypothetical protein
MLQIASEQEGRTMSKIRLALLGAGALLMLSAIGSSSASAAHMFSVEGTEIKSAETAEVVGLYDRIEMTVASTKVAFTCRENASPVKLETSGKSLGKLNYSDCALDEVTSKGIESLLTTCTVTEPIEFKTKGELIGTKGPVEVELRPETGTLFTTLELTGASCALKGKYEVGGSQICSLPGVEVTADDHEVACAESGSKLEVKKEPAKALTDDAIVLVTGKGWSAN